MFPVQWFRLAFQDLYSIIQNLAWPATLALPVFLWDYTTTKMKVLYFF